MLKNECNTCIPLQLTWVHLTLETGADAVTGNCHGDLQVLVVSMETTP